MSSHIDVVELVPRQRAINEQLMYENEMKKDKDKVSDEELAYAAMMNTSTAYAVKKHREAQKAMNAMKAKKQRKGNKGDEGPESRGSTEGNEGDQSKVGIKAKLSKKAKLAWKACSSKPVPRGTAAKRIPVGKAKLILLGSAKLYPVGTSLPVKCPPPPPPPPPRRPIIVDEEDL